MTQGDFNDRQLQSAFQDRSPHTVKGEPCPTPEEIWSAAEGALEPKARQGIIEHSGRCPSCAEDWRIARSLIRRAAEDAPEPAFTRPARQGWAMAAAVALALGGLWLWIPPADPPVLRDDPGQTLESRLPEHEPLWRSDPILQWTGPEGARYRLLVTTERLEVVARVEGLTTTEYRLMDSQIENLPPGSLLLWQLEATLTDGSKLPSTTFRVRLE